MSGFNAKRGFMVRSEGGRVCCDFNDLPRWVKELGAFPAYKCFLIANGVEAMMDGRIYIERIDR